MSVRFILGSSMAYLAVLIADRVASILLTPLTTRLLTPADYSAILLIANGSALINLLFGFTLASAMGFLFTNADSEAGRRSTATTILLLLGALMVLAHAVVFLMSRSISLYFLHTDSYAIAI